MKTEKKKKRKMHIKIWRKKKKELRREKKKTEAWKTPLFSEEAETLGSSAHSPALIFPLKLQ